MKTAVANKLIDALVGLALAAIVLIAIEATLALVGCEKSAGGKEYSRGFSASANYFLPDQETPGGFVTNFYEERAGERRIGPKTTACRILLFGGSNTRGFPAGLLGNYLREKTGGAKYDVVNLGRSGYGSERVRIIFKQALRLLEPDIVLIYSGHNEFVERGFAMDLREHRGGVHSQLTSAVDDTRLFAFFERWFSEQRSSPQLQPEAWEWEYQKFADITYGTTEKYFGAYKHNIRSMCEEARDQGVEVFLSTIVYNRLSMPFSSTLDLSIGPEERGKINGLLGEARNCLPAYSLRLLPESESERLHASDWGHGTTAKRDELVALSGWRSTTGLLSSTDRHLAPESRWKPRVRKLDAVLARFHRRDWGERTRADLERGESLLNEVLQVCGDHPAALFELGMFEYLLGRDAEVYVGHFEAAGGWDRAPRKGSDVTNNIVRRVAAEFEGVHLIDADAIFQECHEDGLVGWEWMSDHCHLHMGGRIALMDLFSEEIVAKRPLLDASK